LTELKRGKKQVLSGLASVNGKGFQLAQYEIFAGTPDFINQDVKNILAVSTADVMRVYNTYIKNKPFVAASFLFQRDKQT
jgi:zinc protease